MGPKSNSASHWCRGALAAASAGLIESPSPKVEPDASASQLLVSLMIPVADVQSHIAGQFVIHEGFPCWFPCLPFFLYI